MKRLALALIAAAACTEPVPDAPTWFGDVQPILMANCARCHGAAADPEAPAGVRLDRYVSADADTEDAWDYQLAIDQRAAIEGTMPVDYALTTRQRELISRWVAAGAPKGTRDNAAPTASLVSGTAPPQVDQSLAFTLTSADLDGDALVVTVGVRDVASGDVWMVAGGLGGGRRDVTVDTGQLASGHDVAVFALVDDGFADDPAANQHEVMLIPNLRVDHGARGTAPTVRVLEPNGGQAILGETTIAWSATDPDPGDTSVASVDLVRVAADGTGTIERNLGSGITGASSLMWDPTGVPTSDGAGPIPYRVRVTVSDAGALNTRSDESDATFTIAPESVPTGLTWDDVRPIFTTYCGECHGQPARTMSLEDFRLDKYDASDPVPPVNGDPGVYEQRALVYQRMIAAANMPPGASPKPSAAQREMVGEWILGGAPRSSGPVDAPPTFVWTAPNDTAITRTTTGVVMLAWTAGDPEGQTITGSIEAARLTANSDQMARCDVPLTGWTAVPADVTAGTYAWTVPATGYHCLRATVADPGGNMISRTALRPVKYSTTPGP
jgi:hypothetical protein